MKIIDEKGRLFGKINVIDFLLILFLLCLIPMFYFGYKLSKKQPVVVSVPKELIETQIECKFIKVRPEIFRLMEAGDKETDEDGAVIGEIVWIGDLEPFVYTFDVGIHDKFIKQDAVLKQFPAKLKITAEIKNNNLYYAGQQILAGLPFKFKGSDYIIGAIPNFAAAAAAAVVEEWVKVRVKFSGLGPEISTIINEGHIERDKDGRIIGKLSAILNTTPTQVSALKLEEKSFIFINDPYRSDIVVSMELLCSKKEYALYFKNFPVKIGSQINFISDLYIASGFIVGIERD